MRPRRQQRGFSTVMAALAWIVLLTILGFYFNELLKNQSNPNRDPQTALIEGKLREVSLQRNRAGHYVTGGSINGQPVTFIVDTGATGVAIPGKLAAALNISRGTAMTTQTANGNSVSYATRLDSVRVGDIEIRDVAAGVSPGLVTQEVLLGMSFLKHLEFTQRGDTLILRQYL